jgi:hypothetical protein
MNDSTIPNASSSWPDYRTVWRWHFYAGLVCSPFVLVLAGCGPEPVTGGTPGTLRDAFQPLAEIQVTVHRQEASAWQPIGTAVTAVDGTFELVTNGAQGPLLLEPGEYSCTLESVGSPLRLPLEYTKAETTPLKVPWSTSDSNLNLNLQTKLELTR